MNKKRQIKRFNKAVEGFIKANEEEQKKALERVLKLIIKGEREVPERAHIIKDTGDVFPEFQTISGIIIFTNEEVNAFSEPFKTLFSALDRRATIIKYADEQGYKITFRRFGYKIEAMGRTIDEAKQNFYKLAREADE